MVESLLLPCSILILCYITDIEEHELCLFGRLHLFELQHLSVNILKLEIPNIVIMVEWFRD